MAILTTAGLGGPQANYPAFQPKTTQQLYFVSDAATTTLSAGEVRVLGSPDARVTTP